MGKFYLIIIIIIIIIIIYFIIIIFIYYFLTAFLTDEIWVILVVKEVTIPGNQS